MKTKFFTILIFILFFSKSYAQVGTWLSVGAEKEIFKKVKIQTNLQIREGDYTKPIDKFLGEVGLVFNLPQGFGLSGFYRYSGTFKTKKDFYEPAHRFYGNLTYEKELAKIIEVQYRFRYQNQFKDTDGIFGSDKSYVRNKIEVSYLINKSDFKPFVSADFFNQLGLGFDQARLKIGTSYKINKKQKVALAFFDDKQINFNTGNIYAFDVSYGIKF
jgi:Protein of unknown function (DUF2490)